MHLHYMSTGYQIYPLRSGLVEKADDWMYSSQRNYSGLESLIEIDIADI
jgi:hypothetical protein